MPQTTIHHINPAADLVGVRTEFSWAYILLIDNNLSLIDAGSDRYAKAIKQALKNLGYKATDVRHIFLTHGHIDNWLGVNQFPKAELHISSDDLPMLYRQRLPKPVAMKTLQWLHRVKSPSLIKLRPFLPGTVWFDDINRIESIFIPGHTQGSSMFKWRQIVFSGDSALVNHGRFILPSQWLCIDWKQNRRNLKWLKFHSYRALADARFGYHPEGAIFFSTWLKKTEQ